MPRPTPIITAAALVVTLAVSGCFTGLSERDVRDAFPDADVRHHDAFDAAVSGYHDAITVPEGTEVIEARLAYRVGAKAPSGPGDRIEGSIQLLVTGPHDSHHEMRSLNLTADHSGLGKSSDIVSSKVLDPPPGAWTLEVTARGEGSYTVGVYFR